MSQKLLDEISKKFWNEEQHKANVIRRNAQKDGRIKRFYDRWLLLLYMILVSLTQKVLRLLQRLTNLRNKYSETFLVHDSHRIFADLLNGSQLHVLQELHILGARKLNDSMLMLKFGSFVDEISDTGVNRKQSDSGMFVVVEAILDGDAPFLKVGMDIWEKEDGETLDDKEK